jgi:hypothetical protein
MKALSVLQPWAWLIVNGYKDIENRKWRINFRGRLLIHAGKRLDRGEYAAAAELAKRNGIEIPHSDNLLLGGVVGVAVVIGCTKASASPWFCGPWGWVLRDAKPLPFRAAKGQLGLFEVPNAILLADDRELP